MFLPKFFLAGTHIGVDLFFLLSGFILYYVYGSAFSNQVTAQDWFRMMQRRLARIYPLHLLTLLMVIVLMRFKILQSDVGILVGNLTLVQAWGLYDRFEFNSPSWSISCEFAAYVAFPFIVLILHRLAGVRGAVLLLAVVFAAYAWLWHLGGGSLDLDAIGRRNVLWRAVGGFPLGILIGWLSVKLTDGIDGLQVGLQSASALIFVGCLWSGAPEIVYILPFGLVVFATASSKGWLVWLLHRRGMKWLGDVSYGIYLLQWPLMLALFSIRPKLAPYFSAFGLEVAALTIFVVALAVLPTLSHRYFERPICLWVARATALR